ncbi:Ankyrin repeat and FYVE domain-containing protein 1 [Orbilia oligospora]|uniref:Ankyrin repeat and FYVE domain-containing protein 1 n=1 Tax=Orbilia oligospora TaxID=2813651 RepID=A0A7C8RMM0_ORBOL|nr:Ankyrin repeat and FYVE domain-containing protein 1 [Orbilia oligospora]
MDEAANTLYLRILKNPQDQLSYQNFSQNLLDATLRIAATNGEVEVVRKLLDQSEASPTSLDEDGKTPLHHAAAGGHCGVIKILLERGNAQQRYYIDTIDNAKKGKVALYYSVSGGHGDATKLLIAERANLDVRNDYGQTLLHQLAESGNEMAVRFLFEQLRLPSIDLEDNLLNTPLYAAVKQGRVSMARLLVEYGANKNVKDKDGETMFHKASRTEDTKTIQPLLEIGLDPFALTNKGENVLYTAARHKQEGFMKELLTAIIPSAKHGTGKALFCAREDDPNRWSLLHHAASQGCLDTIKALLSVAEEAGVELDINELDSLGRPPLYLAAETGCDDIVELLEARGAKVDTLDARGRTFLHRAVREGNVAAANILATRETSPNLNSIKDNDGNIPLHLAGENAYEAVKSLLEKEFGSYLSQRNKLGRNPLHEVAASNDSAAGILGLYLQYGKPLWLRWFKDGNEENALHLAVLKGNIQMVRQLLHPDRLAKKQIEAKDKALETALHKAARYGYVAIAQLLLEKGSSEVERDIKGRIPLHTAARGGKSEVVKVFKFRIGLNNENVKVTWEEYEAFKDNDHKTPYELAVESKDEATIELFSKPRDPKDTSAEATCESSQKEVLPLQHGAEQDNEPDSVQEDPKESEREQAPERETINGSQEQEQDQDQDRASTKRENSSEGLAHQTSGLGIVSSPDPAERQPSQHIIDNAIPNSSPEDDLTPTEGAELPPTVIVSQPLGDDPSIGATENGNNLGLDELSSAEDSTSNGHSDVCENTPVREEQGSESPPEKLDVELNGLENIKVSEPRPILDIEEPRLEDPENTNASHSQEDKDRSGTDDEKRINQEDSTEDNQVDVNNSTEGRSSDGNSTKEAQAPETTGVTANISSHKENTVMYPISDNPEALKDIAENSPSGYDPIELSKGVVGPESAGDFINAGSPSVHSPPRNDEIPKKPAVDVNGEPKLDATTEPIFEGADEIKTGTMHTDNITDPNEISPSVPDRGHISSEEEEDIDSTSSTTELEVEPEATKEEDLSGENFPHDSYDPSESVLDPSHDLTDVNLNTVEPNSPVSADIPESTSVGPASTDEAGQLPNPSPEDHLSDSVRSEPVDCAGSEKTAEPEKITPTGPIDHLNTPGSHHIGSARKNHVDSQMDAAESDEIKLPRPASVASAGIQHANSAEMENIDPVGPGPIGPPEVEQKDSLEAEPTGSAGSKDISGPERTGFMGSDAKSSSGSNYLDFDEVDTDFAEPQNNIDLVGPDRVSPAGVERSDSAESEPTDSTRPIQPSLTKHIDSINVNDGSSSKSEYLDTDEIESTHSAETQNIDSAGPEESQISSPAVERSNSAELGPTVSTESLHIAEPEPTSPIELDGSSSARLENLDSDEIEYTDLAEVRNMDPAGPEQTDFSGAKQSDSAKSEHIDPIRSVHTAETQNTDPVGPKQIDPPAEEQNDSTKSEFIDSTTPELIDLNGPGDRNTPGSGYLDSGEIDQADPTETEIIDPAETKQGDSTFRPEHIDLARVDKSDPAEPESIDFAGPGHIAKPKPTNPTASDYINSAGSKKVDSAEIEQVNSAKTKDIDSTGIEKDDSGEPEPIDPAGSAGSERIAGPEHINPATSHHTKYTRLDHSGLDGVDIVDSTELGQTAGPDDICSPSAGPQKIDSTGVESANSSETQNLLSIGLEYSNTGGSEVKEFPESGNIIGSERIAVPEEIVSPESDRISSDGSEDIDSAGSDCNYAGSKHANSTGAGQSDFDGTTPDGDPTTTEIIEYSRIEHFDSAPKIEQDDSAGMGSVDSVGSNHTGSNNIEHVDSTGLEHAVGLKGIGSTELERTYSAGSEHNNYSPELGHIDPAERERDGSVETEFILDPAETEDIMHMPTGTGNNHAASTEHMNPAQSDHNYSSDGDSLCDKSSSDSQGNCGENSQNTPIPNPLDISRTNSPIRLRHENSNATDSLISSPEDSPVDGSPTAPSFSAPSDTAVASGTVLVDNVKNTPEPTDLSEISMPTSPSTNNSGVGTHNEAASCAPSSPFGDATRANESDGVVHAENPGSAGTLEEDYNGTIENKIEIGKDDIATEATSVPFATSPPSPLVCESPVGDSSNISNDASVCGNESVGSEVVTLSEPSQSTTDSPSSNSNSKELLGNDTTKSSQKIPIGGDPEISETVDSSSNHHDRSDKICSDPGSQLVPVNNVGDGTNTNTSSSPRESVHGDSHDQTDLPVPEARIDSIDKGSVGGPAGAHPNLPENCNNEEGISTVGGIENPPKDNLTANATDDDISKSQGNNSSPTTSSENLAPHIRKESIDEVREHPLHDDNDESGSAVNSICPNKNSSNISATEENPIGERGHSPSLKDESASVNDDTETEDKEITEQDDTTGPRQHSSSLTSDEIIREGENERGTDKSSDTALDSVGGDGSVGSGLVDESPYATSNPACNDNTDNNIITKSATGLSPAQENASSSVDPQALEQEHKEDNYRPEDCAEGIASPGSTTSSCTDFEKLLEYSPEGEDVDAASISSGGPGLEQSARIATKGLDPTDVDHRKRHPAVEDRSGTNRSEAAMETDIPHQRNAMDCSDPSRGATASGSENSDSTIEESAQPNFTEESKRTAGPDGDISGPSSDDEVSPEQFTPRSNVTDDDPIEITPKVTRTQAEKPGSETKAKGYLAGDSTNTPNDGDPEASYSRRPSVYSSPSLSPINPPEEWENRTNIDTETPEEIGGIGEAKIDNGRIQAPEKPQADVIAPQPAEPEISSDDPQGSGIQTSFSAVPFQPEASNHSPKTDHVDTYTPQILTPGNHGPENNMNDDSYQALPPNNDPLYDAGAVDPEVDTEVNTPRSPVQGNTSDYDLEAGNVNIDASKLLEPETSDHFFEGCTENHTVQPEALSTSELENTSEEGYTLEDTPQPESQFTPEDHDLGKAVTPQLIDEPHDDKAQGARDYTYNDTSPCSQTSEMKEPLDSENGPQPRTSTPASETTSHHPERDNAYAETPQTPILDPSDQDTGKLGAATGDPQSVAPKELDHVYDSEKKNSDDATADVVFKTVDNVESPRTNAAIDNAPQSRLPIKSETSVGIIVGDDDYKNSGAPEFPMPHPNNNGSRKADIDDNNLYATGLETNHPFEKLDGDSGASEIVSVPPSPTAIPDPGNSGQGNSSTSSSTSQRAGPGNTDHAPSQLDVDYGDPEPAAPVETGHTSEEFGTGATANQPVAPQVSQDAPQKEGTGSNTPQLAPLIFNNYDSEKSDADTNEVSPAFSETSSIVENDDINTISPQLTGTEAKDAPGKSDDSSGIPTQVVRSTDGASNASSECCLNEHSDQSEVVVSKGSRNQEEDGINDNSFQNTVSHGGDCPEEVETVDSAPPQPSSKDKNTLTKTETNDSSSDPAVLTPKPTLGGVYSNSNDYQSTDILSETGSSHGEFDPNGSGEPPAGSTSELKPRHTAEVVGLDENHPQSNASQIDGNGPEQKDVTNTSQGSEDISQLELNGPPILSIASSRNEGNYNQEISQPGVLTGPLTTTISSSQKALEAHEIEMPVLDSKESKPSDTATPQPHSMELENHRGGQEEKGSVTSTISENEPQSIIIPAQDNVPQIPIFDVIDTIEDPSPTKLENDSQEKDSPNPSHTIPPPRGNVGESLTEDSVMDSPSTSTNAANGNGSNSKGVCDGTTNTNPVDDNAPQSEISHSVKVPSFSLSDITGKFSNNSNDGSPPKSTATISNPSLVLSSSPDKALDEIEISLRDVEGGDYENTTTDEAATGDPHSDSEEDHDNDEKNPPVPENTTEDFPTFSTGTIDNPGENITDSPNQTSASPISPEPLTSNPVHTDQESQSRDQPAEASSAPLEPRVEGLQQHTAENTNKFELDSIKNPSPVEGESTSNKSGHDIPHVRGPNSSDLTTVESSESQKPGDDPPLPSSTTGTTFPQGNNILRDVRYGSAQQDIRSNSEESSVDQFNGPSISFSEQNNPNLARQPSPEPLSQTSGPPTPPIPARVEIGSNRELRPVTQTTGGDSESIKSSEATRGDPSEQCSIIENGSVDENIAPVNLEPSDTQPLQSHANKDSAENTQAVQIIPTTPVTASDAVHDYPRSQSQEATNTEDPSDSTNKESTMPIRPENSPPNNTTTMGEHVSDYNEGLSGEEAPDTEALSQSPFFSNFPNVSSRRLMGPESSSDPVHHKGPDPKKVVNGFDVDTPLMFHPNSPFSTQSSDPQGSSAQDSTEDISGDSTKSGAMGVGLGVSLPQNTTTDNNHGYSTPLAATNCESSLSGGNLDTVGALPSWLNNTTTVATTPASENATIPPIASPVKIDIIPAGTTTSKSTIVVPSTTNSPLNTESAALTSDSTSVPPPIANLPPSGNPATVAGGVPSDSIRAPLTVANPSSGNITALGTSVAQNRARTPPPITNQPLSSAAEAIAGVPANNTVATETAVPSNSTSSLSITNSLSGGSSVGVIGKALPPPANPPSNGVTAPEIAVNPDGTNASPSTTGSPFSSTPVAITEIPSNGTSATETGATGTGTSSSVTNPLPSSTPATATRAPLNNVTTAENSVPSNNTSTSLSITIPQSNSAPAPTAGSSPDKTSASPSAINVEQNNASPMATTTAPSGTNASPSIRNSLSNGFTAAKTRVSSAASSVKNWFFRTPTPVNSGDPRDTQSDIRETSHNGNSHDAESSAASTSTWELVDSEEEDGYIYSVGVSTPFQISYYDIISLNGGGFRSRGMGKILRILAKSRTVKEIPSLASTRYYRGVLHRQNEPIQPNTRNFNINMKKMTKESISEVEKSRITTWLATRGRITGPSKISETVKMAPNNSSIFLIEIDKCCRFQDEDELNNCLRRTVIACFDHYKIQEDNAEAIIFIVSDPGQIYTGVKKWPSRTVSQVIGTFRFVFIVLPSVLLLLACLRISARHLPRVLQWFGFKIQLQGVSKFCGKR